MISLTIDIEGRRFGMRLTESDFMAALEAMKPGRTLDEIERWHIERALAQKRDESYQSIADRLGISKKSLYDKRKRLELD